VQIFHVRGGGFAARGWVADRSTSGTDVLIEQFLLQLYADTRHDRPGRGAREIRVPAAALIGRSR
jgi:excinuclease UvrABC nuclease subunit